MKRFLIVLSVVCGLISIAAMYAAAFYSQYWGDPRYGWSWLTIAVFGCGSAAAAVVAYNLHQNEPKQ